MDEILQWVLIVLAMSIPAIIVALINYFLYKKKIVAETENIKANTKITKEITYDQLQKESKQKDIKGKIEIFSRLNKLETEIKNRENKTASDQRKLESLEMIKEEFKTSLIEPESEPKKKSFSESTKKLLVNKKGSKVQKKKKK
jgi:signal transduction histidine kinase